MEIFGVYLVNQSSGVTIPLFQDKENIIGRGIPSPQGEQGKVLLPHPSISKVHATISLKPETYEWIIYDKSRHGILVNGDKVNKQMTLHHGDCIEVGPFNLMFYEKFNSDDETAEQPLPLAMAQKQNKKLKWGFSLLIPAFIETLLALFSPWLLLGISIVLAILCLLMLRKKFRDALQLSLTTIIICFLFAMSGILLGASRIQADSSNVSIDTSKPYNKFKIH